MNIEVYDKHKDSVELANLGNILLGECHPYNIDKANKKIPQVGGFLYADCH